MTPILKSYLATHGIAHEFITKTHTIHTADAAEATGIPLEQITKSLACLGSDGKAYVAIIPGTCKIDFKAVAREFALKSVRLAPFEQAHQFTGYPPGATPPLAYAKITGVVVDQALQRFEWIYGGGGTNEQLMKIRTADVIAANHALVASITLAG